MQMVSRANDQRGPHDGMSRAVIGEAPRPYRNEAEALSLSHLRRTPCPGVCRGRVKERVVVGPHHCVTDRDAQVRGSKPKLVDANQLRLGRRTGPGSARGRQRPASQRPECQAERRGPHFFASTSARTCSAWARCAATAGRTAVRRPRSSEFLTACSITLSIDARNFWWYATSFSMYVESKAKPDSSRMRSRLSADSSRMSRLSWLSSGATSSLASRFVTSALTPV